MCLVDSSSLHLLSSSTMAFTGKYELESQENYEEFLAIIGQLSAKTDQKVITDVVQDGNNFTWTQSLPGWTWCNNLIAGQECDLQTMKGDKFRALVTLDGGKISVPFPKYHFTAEIIEGKLMMNCTTGEKGVTFKRISRRV
ncbi:gastrotropin-like [Labrus mixtus]|uniref:gastrotropin-like n=1 Tax=Labrus mixtus TaxID=508554 RepID=UPI0029C08C2D|nr:gastrotropin-like [Labrus mixtus]